MSSAWILAEGQEGLNIRNLRIFSMSPTTEVKLVIVCTV